MAFLGETDWFLYFNKKFDWIWGISDDKTLVFNQQIWKNEKKHKKKVKKLKM
jgi:hypothetical protein